MENRCASVFPGVRRHERAPRASRELSRSVPERSWRAPGRFQSALGRPGAPQERSWGGPGALLTVPGASRKRPGSSRVAPKRPGASPERLWVDFGSILARFGLIFTRFSLVFRFDLSFVRSRTDKRTDGRTSASTRHDILDLEFLSNILVAFHARHT
jgi:hypothetical protein